MPGIVPKTTTSWTLTKIITVGSQSVPVVCTAKTDPNGKTVVNAAVTLGSITYSENWTLPRDNSNYTQTQAQADFTAHVTKVASRAFARNNNLSILTNLK